MRTNRNEPEEFSRPPKGEREHPYEKMKREDLYFFRVTETPNMRNMGASIVNEKLGKGYHKPENPDLLQMSPDGCSFNLIIPKEERLRQVERNNRRAKLYEGFRDDVNAPMGLDAKATPQPVEEGKVSGKEMERELLATGTNAKEHDG